ncbi:putative copper homeostasis (lipo)protein LpqS [Nocardia sp. NPDC003345]
MTATATQPGPAPHRFRSAPRLLGVLIVLLTAVSLLHCDLLAPAAHAHPEHAVNGVTATGHTHASGAFDSHCPTHTVHCVPQVILPHRVGDLFDSLGPGVLAATTLAAISATLVTGGRPRGPPTARPALGGQRILTLFCIARR